jgi:hypothetical protein
MAAQLAESAGKPHFYDYGKNDLPAGTFDNFIAFIHEVTEAARASINSMVVASIPEIFDRLYEDWATLERFQRIRGVLRLMAAVIHELWMANDASLLIMPGSIPLDVRDEQAVRLVILRPTDEYKAANQNNKAMSVVMDFLNNRGTTPRIFRNMPAFTL